RNEPKHTPRRLNAPLFDVGAYRSSCGADAEADLREMIDDFSQARLLALDRNLIHRAGNHLSYHRIESIVVRHHRNLGADLDAVGIVGILVLARRGRALARDLERLV